MDLDRREKKYWLAYRAGETIDYSVVKALAGLAGSLERSWNNRSILSSSKLKPTIKSTIVKLWRQINPDKLIDRVERTGINFITIIESGYPVKLSQIADPPFLIFYQGRLIGENDLALASVGARKATNYGLGSVKKIIEPLAKRGVVIVSGLAYGIDEASHRACLSQSGRTIAVLGGGISEQVIYPASNRGLAQKIVAKGGSLISEYLPWQRPEKRYFVARNRIISGLSDGVFIVEAGKRSGSLITAEFALDQGRDVFALPGNIDQANSVGSNSLIKDGAYLISGPADFLNYFNLENNHQPLSRDFSKKERLVYQIIKEKPISMENIIRKTSLDASRLSVILANMEIEGFIKRQPDSKYKIS